MPKNVIGCDVCHRSIFEEDGPVCVFCRNVVEDSSEESGVPSEEIGLSEEVRIEIDPPISRSRKAKDE